MSGGTCSATGEPGGISWKLYFIPKPFFVECVLFSFFWFCFLLTQLKSLLRGTIPLKSEESETYAGWHLSCLSQYKHRIHVCCLKFLGRFRSWMVTSMSRGKPFLSLVSHLDHNCWNQLEIISDGFCCLTRSLQMVHQVRFLGSTKIW